LAVRLCFISTPDYKKAFDELVIEFKYFTGFAITQKQKSIKSMHDEITKRFPDLDVLEVSTKSLQPIGVKLSAFKLMYYDENTRKEYPIENVFQSSKVFEGGGPYRELLYVPPKDAKRSEKLRQSGQMTHFEHNNQKWGLEPKSLFYDWIYMKAVSQKYDMVKEIINYNAFTDIEFNHKKSLNCQARSAAIFVSLYNNNLLESALQDINVLKSAYGYKGGRENLQLSIDTLFDD
jgi:hypothetical protein